GRGGTIAAEDHVIEAAGAGRGHGRAKVHVGTVGVTLKRLALAITGGLDKGAGTLQRVIPVAVLVVHRLAAGIVEVARPITAEREFDARLDLPRGRGVHRRALRSAVLGQ